MAKLEKILTMSDDEIQKWLGLIHEDDLMKALIGVDEQVKACILHNMSARAGAVIDNYLRGHTNLDASSIDQSIGVLEKALESVS
jgi:flagellar motor switch protein FliG